jgi:hypothetical protein
MKVSNAKAQGRKDRKGFNPPFYPIFAFFLLNFPLKPLRPMHPGDLALRLL